MKLVYACLSARKDRESSFHLCRVAVKLMQAWLSGKRRLESSLHHCGGPVKLMEACLSAGSIEKSGFTTAEVLRISCRPG